MTMGIGTPTYTGPELLATRSNGGRCTYTAMADIFSLGIILGEIFHPFRTAMERARVLMMLRQGKIPTCLEEDFPREASL